LNTHTYRNIKTHDPSSIQPQPALGKDFSFSSSSFSFPFMRQHLMFVAKRKISSVQKKQSVGSTSFQESEKVWSLRKKDCKENSGTTKNKTGKKKK